MLAITALACTAAIPAVALAAGGTAATHAVTLREFRFHPHALTIRRGDKVTWVWRDQTDHNVTFRGFHSRTQEHGSYTVRFTRRGTYNYRCTIHAAEGMRGTVVVH